MSELRYLPKEEREGKLVISASGLIEMMNSPKHYYSRYILGEQEETKAKEDGTLLHMAYYENEKFLEKYEVLNDKSEYLSTADEIKEKIKELGGKPKGKKDELINQLLELDSSCAIWDSYLSQIKESGKKIISADDHKKVLRVIEGINGHWWLSKLPTENRQVEVAGHYTHKSGVIISFRLDDLRFANNGQPIILDLKKTRNASPESFSRDIWNYKLFVQAAIYTDAIKDIFGIEPKYAWIASEFASPFCLEVYAADFGMIEAGRAIYNKMIMKYQECMESDLWPSYGNGKVQEIALPHWAYNKLDEYAEQELNAE